MRAYVCVRGSTCALLSSLISSERLSVAISTSYVCRGSLNIRYSCWCTILARPILFPHHLFCPYYSYTFHVSERFRRRQAEEQSGRELGAIRLIIMCRYTRIFVYSIGYVHTYTHSNTYLTSSYVARRCVYVLGRRRRRR